MVIIHQDSFAADYQDEEYALFGKAMKFAGIYGKEIRVIGKNRGRSPRRKLHPHNEHVSAGGAYAFDKKGEELFLVCIGLFAPTDVLIGEY